MAQDKTGPDATPRSGLDTGRQALEASSDNNVQEERNGPDEESIRQRAHEIREREGRTGDPDDHWYRAERELRQSPQERSEATVENAPPASAAEAAAAISRQPSDE